MDYSFEIGWARLTAIEVATRGLEGGRTWVRRGKEIRCRSFDTNLLRITGRLVLLRFCRLHKVAAKGAER